MSWFPTKETSRKALKSHSWIGIATGAILYLICLSGALVVLNPDIARWEQPLADEYSSIEIEKLQQRYVSSLQDSNPAASHLFIILPTDTSPRAKISTGMGSFYINEDGSLGEKVEHEWMTLITRLHMYLHLPYNWGRVVVSLFGVLLCAGIVSGVLSHRRILKDAFSFRHNANKTLQQSDVHNRLSVWLLPFHFMAGLTGAYFGLASLLLAFYASIYFNDDTNKLHQAIYGEKPVLQQQTETADLAAAMHNLTQIAPDAEPFYVALEAFNTPAQYIVIGATHPDKFMYAEKYRFDNRGRYLGSAGFSEGPVARQVVSSVYRLHSGYYGPPLIRLLYLFSAITLAVICVSGVNIWLSKRLFRDNINNVWTGIVWGAPLALSLTALVAIVSGFTYVSLFWITIIIAGVLSCKINDHERSKWLLSSLGLVVIAGLLISHNILYGAASWQGGAFLINLVWSLAIGFLLLQCLIVIKASHRR